MEQVALAVFLPCFTDLRPAPERGDKMIKRLAINLLEDMLLIVLAGDLLYLYYAGAWYDPVRWIELTEVVLLYLIVAFGLVRFHFHFRRRE